MTYDDLVKALDEIDGHLTDSLNIAREVVKSPEYKAILEGQSGLDTIERIELSVIASKVARIVFALDPLSVVLDGLCREETE